MAFVSTVVLGLKKNVLVTVTVFKSQVEAKKRKASVFSYQSVMSFIVNISREPLLLIVLWY